MKKFLSIILLVLLMSSPTFAYKNSVKFGIQSYTYDANPVRSRLVSDLALNGATLSDFNIEPGTGFAVGGATEIPLLSNLDFSTGLSIGVTDVKMVMATSVLGAVQNFKMTTTYTYLELPINLNLNLGNGFKVFGGFSTAYTFLQILDNKFLFQV